MDIECVVSDEPLYKAVSGHPLEKQYSLSWKDQFLLALGSVLCGFVTWYTLHSCPLIHFSWVQDLLLGSGITLILGLLVLNVHHARCTVSLLIPAFCGSNGRAFIRSFLIGILLTGPMENIINNGELLSTSICCSSELTVAQAEQSATSGFDMVNTQMKTVHDSIADVNKRTAELEAEINADILRSLDAEDDGGHTSPKRMLKQGETQCHRNIVGPRKKCELQNGGFAEECEKLNTEHDGCSDYHSGSAEQENLILSQNIKSSVDGIGEQLANPNVSIKSTSFKKINTLTLVEQFKMYISTIRSVMHGITTVISIFAIFMLCVVIKNAIGIQVSFLTHYSFLNNVVTTALKELDANQPSEDRAFPLPKYMLRFVRDGKRKLLTASEAGVLVIITLKHAIFSLFFLSLVALDQAVFIVLEDIGSTGYVIYEEYVKVGVTMENDGGAWIKPILNNIPKVNNIDYHSFVQDNNECLPDPLEPCQTTQHNIISLLTILLILNYGQVYSRRLLRVICVHFYPEREGQRRLFLYRFLKQRRLDCFQQLVDEAKGCLITRSTLSSIMLRILGPRCTVCGDGALLHPCEHCSAKGFDVYFCQECWKDSKKQCLFCTELSPEPSVTYIKSFNTAPGSFYSTSSKYSIIRPEFADDSSDEDESLSMGDEAAYNLFSPERVRSGLNEDQMMLYEMGGQT